MIPITTIDYETQAIELRPAYPPVPVGVSIQLPGERKSTYWAWGHPAANNCSKTKAQQVLRGIWRDAAARKTRLLFHHAKFDYDVSLVHMGLPPLPWDCIDDTMFLLFLTDPHANTFSLKPAAERILGLPPEEQDAVRRWLIDNNMVKRNDRSWGAHIAKAPGDIVGRYADGDVLRTNKLFRKLHPEIVKRGMTKAYDRERELMPVLLRNEAEGIRVDVPLLKREAALYMAGMEAADAWLRKRLKAPELEIDSDRDLANALDKAGIVKEWVATATGQRSTSKKNMTGPMFKDQRVFQVLGWRNRVATCVRHYQLPWLDMAQRSGGLIHLNWNQVRQMRGVGDNTAGARTGRMSCNPALMAVSKAWHDKDDGYVHPTVMQLPELPLVRRYILPDKGGVIIHRDYNQQELRILGHYENGKLMDAYNEDPNLDVHEFARLEMQRVAGLQLERRQVKIINFGSIYGRGIGNLAGVLRVSYDEAKVIKTAQLQAIPGLKQLNADIKAAVKAGEPIRTWGGREYFVEAPEIIDGRLQTYEYKLLNYLIQGSAADCTKQAIINYDYIKRDGRWMLAVHDENNGSTPKGTEKRELKLLKDAMEGVKFDVPMLTDAAVGKNWGELKKLKEAA